MKSHVSLRDFVTAVSRTAEKIFYKHGGLGPMWHYLDRDGTYHVHKAPNADKDTSTAIMRALLELVGATRCLFVDEAWIVATKASDPDYETFIEEAKVKGVSDHPRRQEVIMFAAEDQREGFLMARCSIERLSSGKVKIGPLIIDERFDNMEGRLVGMLPKQPNERVQ
jgi:hypothetical protein